MKGTGAERDNGARGRCTGAQVQEGTGQSAITVHGRAREGAGDAASDYGARGRCTEGPGQSAITVHGDGARAQGAGDRGRA